MDVSEICHSGDGEGGQLNNIMSKKKNDRTESYSKITSDFLECMGKQK